MQGQVRSAATLGFGMATAWLACGGRVKDDQTVLGPVAVEDSVALSDASCSAEWQQVYASQQGSLGGPSFFAVRGNELVFDELGFVNATEGPGLLVHLLDTKSGADTALPVSFLIEDLWVDRNALVVWTGTEFLAVEPLAGRLEPLSSSFPPSAASAERGGAQLTPSELFWTRPGEDDPRAVELWRQDRGSGESTRVAALDRSRFSSPELAVGADGVVVSGSTTGPGAFIALPGGEQLDIERPEDGTQVGIGSRGLYYSRVFNRTRQGGRANRVELLRARADSSGVERLWRGAAGQFVDSVWELEDGLLGTGHYYRGGRVHAVVLLFDERGNSRVLACHPDFSSFMGEEPIIVDGQLYAIARDGSAWSIVRTEVQGAPEP